MPRQCCPIHCGCTVISLHSSLRRRGVRRDLLVCQVPDSLAHALTVNKGCLFLCLLESPLQAWYATHPPKRGDWWKGTRPFVHQGFLKSWVANGLNQTIVKRMQDAVEAMQDDGGKVKLYVTGATSKSCGFSSIPSSSSCEEEAQAA